MIDRRCMMTGALASLAAPAMLRAQVLPPPGFGRPSGTFPFEPEVFRQRRARVLGELQTGVAVLYGADTIHTAGAVPPRFQQDPDFAWLTGIVDEPGAILILAPAEREHREILLLPSRLPEVERWDVERLPLGSELERRSGFRRVGRTSELGGLVTSLAARHKELRFLGPIVQPTAAVPPVLDLYSRVSQRVPGVRITDDSRLMPSLRIVKEPRELDQMRRAMAATRRGHLAAMQQVRPGWTERQLQHLVEAEFRAGGGQELGYASIVAAGRNAASLHYTGGDGVIRPGALVLIDAGASVGGYASDVTRTFPVSGRFTPEQRRTYELVLAAQEAAVSKLRAGAYFSDLNDAAKQVFRSAGRVDDFYHGLGHLVGLHVHDAGDLSRPLPAGAVVTIEPGLYVQAENYGVRIEDQYLVTSTGAERMSAGIPRTVGEIESFMGASRR